DAAPAEGERLFAACRGCHTNAAGGAHSVGPNLWDVVGRDIASAEGYSYSPALQALEGAWTYDALNGFIHAPRDFAPGTKMTYAGLPDTQARANLIAYLRTLSDDPAPLPTQEEIDAVTAAQQAAAEGEPEAEDGAAAAADEGAATEE